MTMLASLQEVKNMIKETVDNRAQEECQCKEKIAELTCEVKKLNKQFGTIKEEMLLRNSHLECSHDNLNNGNRPVMSSTLNCSKLTHFTAAEGDLTRKTRSRRTLLSEDDLEIQNDSDDGVQDSDLFG